LKKKGTALSLRLLIDEDTQSAFLVRLLREAGHDVLTVNEAGLNGKIDPIILDRAREEDRILLTQNCNDFKELHQLDNDHPGILAVYNDDDRSKNMSFKEIVRALANLETAAFALPGVKCQ
jgi:predicted nuclease of predicted toxin-antitoxin system